MSQQNQQNQKDRPQQEMDEKAPPKTGWAEEPRADNKDDPLKGPNA